MSGEKPKIVFVLGGPGAGKGTQCAKISEEFGYTHISAGELLRREESDPSSVYREEIEKCFQKSTIVPIKITCDLIKKEMEKDGGGKFIIDGFPRNKDNLDGWNTHMSHRVELLFVLSLHCDDEVCVARCVRRGQEGSGRKDDNQDSVRKRLKLHDSDTVPIIEHYEGMGLVRRIDTSKPVVDVYEDVRRLFLPGGGHGQDKA